MDAVAIVRQRLCGDFRQYNIDNVDKAVEIFSYLLSCRTHEQLTEYATASDEQFYDVIVQAGLELNSLIDHNAAYHHMPPPSPGYMLPPPPSSFRMPPLPPPPPPPPHPNLGSNSLIMPNAAASPSYMLPPWNDQYSWPRYTSPAPPPISRPVASTSSFGGPTGWHDPHLTISNAQLVIQGGLDSRGGSMMRSAAAAAVPAEACYFFKTGFCREGYSCRFSHDDIASGGTRGQPSVVVAEEASKYNKEKSDLYLSFPCFSTFTEDDVLKYFSQFGPVVEVRIPHQETRIFGFVSFRYPHTVNGILAMNRPHLIGGASVVAKRYKEKAQQVVYERSPHSAGPSGSADENPRTTGNNNNDDDEEETGSIDLPDSPFHKYTDN